MRGSTELPQGGHSFSARVKDLKECSKEHLQTQSMERNPSTSTWETSQQVSDTHSAALFHTGRKVISYCHTLLAACPGSLPWLSKPGTLDYVLVCHWGEMSPDQSWHVSTIRRWRSPLLLPPWNRTRTRGGGCVPDASNLPDLKTHVWLFASETSQEKCRPSPLALPLQLVVLSNRISYQECGCSAP